MTTLATLRRRVQHRLATARAFAARGWLIGALGRDDVGLERLAAKSGDWRRVVHLAEHQALVAAAAALGQASGGQLDLLLADAGIDAKGPFAATDSPSA